MSIELKIKSKHLALEPAIIRKEEQKLSKQIKHYKMHHQITTDSDVFSYYDKQPDLYNLYCKHSSLVSHRRWNVRNEARATYLARAYIKGVPYKVVESNVKETIHGAVMDSLVRMVLKYSKQRFRTDYEKGAVVKTAENKAKDAILAWMNKV